MNSQFAVTTIHHYFDRLSESINGPVRTSGWEQKLSLPASLGTGTITRMRIRQGMEIVITDMTLERDMRLRIQEACRIFELSYCVSGEIRCEWNGKQMYTGDRTGNVLYLDDVQVCMEKKAGLRHRLLEVRLCPDELLRYADDSEDRQVMESMLQRHLGSIDKYPDSPAVQKCVFDLVQCGYEGTMRRLYLESKAMELIALYGQEAGHGRRGGKPGLRLDDVDKLRQVRELVLNHLDNPLSIRELARRSGVNECKLKSGFRELFGTTVFELVRSKRMEKALRLMDLGRMNFGETAVYLGYSNMSNFSAAFRKQYGCNPGDYLKQLFDREAQPQN